MSRVEPVPEPAPRPATKWVYSFGAGRADGSAGRPRSARRQGRLSCRDVAARPSRAAGLHHLGRGLCSVYYELGAQAARRAEADGQRGARWGRQDRRRRIRRCGKSAARVGQVGQPRLDARHDGYRAQSRAQRSDRRGARACARATAASPTTPIAASSRCMPTWCSASTMSCSRRSWRTYKGLKGFEYDTELGAEDWAEHRRPLQDPGRERARHALPAGYSRPAVGRHRRRVRLLAERARHRLSPPARYSRRLGYRRHHPGHGVRQYGRAERDRRRVHAQPLDRRQRALRRVPGQRARRGRGGWPAYAATFDRSGAPRRERRSRPSLEALDARRLRRAEAACAKLEAHFRDIQDIEFTVQDGKLFMLQTRSGKRSTQAALKIAVDMAEEGLISREEAVEEHQCRPARPAAASDPRPQRREDRARQGACPPRQAPPPASSCSTPTRPCISRRKATP